MILFHNPTLTLNLLSQTLCMACSGKWRREDRRLEIDALRFKRRRPKLASTSSSLTRKLFNHERMFINVIGSQFMSVHWRSFAVLLFWEWWRHQATPFEREASSEAWVASETRPSSTSTFNLSNHSAFTGNWSQKNGKLEIPLNDVLESFSKWQASQTGESVRRTASPVFVSFNFSVVFNNQFSTTKAAKWTKGYVSNDSDWWIDTQPVTCRFAWVKDDSVN